MNYQEFSDQELYSMICESNEDAKDLMYDKYKYVIDVIVKNYIYTAKKLGVEYNDLYQEGLVGFSDALNCYDEKKNVKLSTFIGLCVDRRLQNIILKAGRMKNKILLDSLSLDHEYGEQHIPLVDMICDQKNNDPFDGILKEEEYRELMLEIKKELSQNEYEVYEFLIQGLNYQDIALILHKTPKQVDNTMQRIKTKIRDILRRVKLG